MELNESNKYYDYNKDSFNLKNKEYKQIFYDDLKTFITNSNKINSHIKFTLEQNPSLFQDYIFNLYDNKGKISSFNSIIESINQDKAIHNNVKNNRNYLLSEFNTFEMNEKNEKNDDNDNDGNKYKCNNDYLDISNNLINEFNTKKKEIENKLMRYTSIDELVHDLKFHVIFNYDLSNPFYQRQFYSTIKGYLQDDNKYSSILLLLPKNINEKFDVIQIIDIIDMSKDENETEKEKVIMEKEKYNNTKSKNRQNFDVFNNNSDYYSILIDYFHSQLCQNQDKLVTDFYLIKLMIKRKDENDLLSSKYSLQSYSNIMSKIDLLDSNEKRKLLHVDGFENYSISELKLLSLLYEYDQYSSLYNNKQYYITWISNKEFELDNLYFKIIQKVNNNKRINGKFTFYKNNNNVYFISRWIYSINIKSEETLIFELNLLNDLNNDDSMYIGLAILKTSLPNLSLVEFIPLNRSERIITKVNLKKGSYIIIPLSLGYFFKKDKNEMYDYNIINYPIIFKKIFENNKNYENLNYLYYKDDKPYVNETNCDFKSSLIKINTQNIDDEFYIKVKEHIFSELDYLNNGYLELDSIKCLYMLIYEKKYVFEIGNSKNKFVENVENICKEKFKDYIDNKIDPKIDKSNFFILFDEHKDTLMEIFGYYKLKDIDKDINKGNNYGNDKIDYYIYGLKEKRFELNVSIFNNTCNSCNEISIADGFKLDIALTGYIGFIKEFGKVIIENNEKVSLIGDYSPDKNVLLLLIENNSSSDKKITLEINCKGFISYNLLTYTCHIKSQKSSFVFPLLIYNEDSTEEVFISYKLSTVNT